MSPRGLTALAAILAACAVLPGPGLAQDAEAPPEQAAPEAPAKPKPRPKPKPKPPAAKAPAAAQPEPAPQPPALPVEAYAEAAATTIIAEQSCPGLRLNAGALTTLRLSARVAPAQEAALEERLRERAAEIRRQLALDGREAWCAAAVASFGPAGSVARGVLAPGR